ncbi:MAG: hypothetical protein OHK0052_07800 [Anaerolineales bacterium]
MLPLYCDTHFNLHNEDLPFWQNLAQQAAGAILELGCGTGRVLLHLARQGYAVTGVDNDPAMLNFLQERLPADLLHPPRLLHADMTRLPIEDAYALVLIPCNTFSLLSPENRRAALNEIVRLLLPGGLLAVSIPNPRVLRSLPARGEPEMEETLQHPLTGNPLQVSSEWQRRGNRFTLHWHYDHLFPDGRSERVTGTVIHQLDSPETYLNEVRAAGLEIVATYGDFGRAPFDAKESDLLVWVAQKSG